ncbi:Myb DNA-binding domain containing protein [Pyrenophora tritici-repentis]|nr:Myb DNA-binding domain containing protein [Pyrenophora tritici-repentis]
MAEREARSPTIERTYMPKPTPLPHSYDQASRLGTRDSSILSSLNAGHDEYCTTSLALPTTDLYSVEHRDGTYIKGSVEERLQARRSIALSEELEPEEDIGQESSRDVVNTQSSGRKTGEIIQKKLGRNGSCIIPPSRSQRPRRRAWTPEMGRGNSNTAPRSLDYNTAPTKPSQQVRLTQLQQSSISERLNTEKGSQIYLSGSNSLGTTAEDGNNIDYESRSSMSCQIKDLTLCAIPDDSSVVTAILHLSSSNHSLSLLALGHKVTGEQGKVIRMTQLSPDSWLLLGYRCNGSPADLSNCERLNKKRMNSAHSDAVSNGTDRSNDSCDEDDENGEENTKEHSRRTHKQWLESEEVLLLSLKDKQGMEWEEICKRFPSRSPGAVKLRYYTLKKRS